MSTIELMDRGMKCLVESLGIVEAERFIAVINREKFDYTKWRKSQFDSMSLEEIGENAVAYAKQNPFNGKQVTMI